MTERAIKTPKDSEVSTRYLVMPDMANPYGSVFGGVMLSWIDMVASMCAMRHCRANVVTASIDSVSFSSPVYVGDNVVLKASVNYVGKSSMEVGVAVFREQPLTGIRTKATTAYLTMVALDSDRNPILVPDLKVESPLEIKRFEQAKQRVEYRKQMRQQRQVGK